MKKYTNSLLFIILLCFNVLIGGNYLVYANENETINETIANVRVKNIFLQTKLFLHEIENGLKGVGYDDYSGLIDIEAQINSYAQEKIFTLAAFYHRYVISGTTMTYAWAENELLTTLQSNFSKYHKILRAESEKNKSIYFTIDSMIALEFLTSAYRDSQNNIIKNQLLDHLFIQRESMKANNTPEYQGPSQSYHLAFWTAIKGEGYETGLNSYYKYTSGGDPNLQYCLANTSLWAIAGMLNYGLLVRESSIDVEQEIFNASLNDAQKTMKYLEDVLFINGKGFKEYSNASTDKIIFRTQALSLLSYARLYQATGNVVYIDKAESVIVNIINPYFIDSEKGGAVVWFNSTSGIGANIKEGYGNALYAYSLMELFKASGQEKYLTTATEVINFLGNYMYKKSSDDLNEGYIEFIQKNGTIYDPPGFLSNTTRLWKTNALIFYINEDIYFTFQPLFVKNMIWIITGIIALIGIIVIVLLINKYRVKGKKLSKTIKTS